MTRDYKHKTVAPKKVYQRRSQIQQPQEESEKRISPKLIWVLALVMSVGLIGGFLIVQHFAEHGVKSSSQDEGHPHSEKLTEMPTEPEPGLEEIPLQKVKSSKTQAVNQLDDQARQKIEYTFYNGLAKTEVVVDVEPLSVKLEAPYLIQAGTFNTEARALKEQKRLAVVGLELKLTSILYKKKRYYRLRLGPFDDRLELNKRRNELRAMGVDTLLIRQKQP